MFSTKMVSQLLWSAELVLLSQESVTKKVSSGCFLPGRLLPFVKLSCIEVQHSERGVGIQRLGCRNAVGQGWVLA